MQKIVRFSPIHICESAKIKLKEEINTLIKEIKKKEVKKEWESAYFSCFSTSVGSFLLDLASALSGHTIQASEGGR